MRIQWGVHIGLQNAPIDDLRRLWRHLDPHLDWISIWDHLYEVPPQSGKLPHYEALTCLGALCAETSHARIGVLVFYVGFRNPAYLAKAAVSLDHISGGRFELGLGAGWSEQEATAFGYEFPGLVERMEMLEEALPLIRTALSGESLTFAGRYYSTNELVLNPRPISGSIPIWIGGKGRQRTPKIAAMHADWWNAPTVSLEEFVDMNQAVDHACVELGRDPDELKRAVNLPLYLATPRFSEAAALDAATQQVGVNGLDTALVGRPERIVDRLLGYVNAGANQINFGLRLPIAPDFSESFVEDLMPTVRQAFGNV